MIDAILDTSRQVMREDGVAALNLHEVARRLSIRTPSLYEYFNGKMALYDALFALGVHVWAEHVDRVFERTYDTPWQFLHTLFETYVDFGDDQPELYKLIHERHVPGFEPSPESLAASVRQTQRGVESLQKWVDAGVMTPGMPTAEAFDLIIVVMHGLVGTHVGDKPGERSPISRFRAMIPRAVALFQSSWSPKSPQSRRSKK